MLGNNVYSDEGILNRKLVATLVFLILICLQNTMLLFILLYCKIPIYGCISIASSAYILKEAALLFESGSYKSLDKIICVTAPEILRIERVMRRDTISENAVKQRMKNQWSEAEKAALSDYIIINDGNTMLIPQVMNVHQQLSAICN